MKNIWILKEPLNFKENKVFGLEFRSELALKISFKGYTYFKLLTTATHKNIAISDDFI